jgi:hypothetical protein
MMCEFKVAKSKDVPTALYVNGEKSKPLTTSRLIPTKKCPMFNIKDGKKKVKVNITFEEII